MNDRTSTNTLSYSAANYYKALFGKGVMVLLICVAAVVAVSLQKDGLNRAVIAIVSLFVLFVIVFGAFVFRAQKKFAKVILSQEEILIRCPDGEAVRIPWNDQISVSFFDAPMYRSASNGAHFELILSSAPLPYSYQADHIEAFSAENYRASGTWRVSLGRGSRKWCEKESQNISMLRDSDE